MLRELTTLPSVSLLPLCYSMGRRSRELLSPARSIDQSARPTRLGFVLFVAIACYVSLWRLLPRWTRPVLPAMVTISAVSMRFYFAGHDHLRPLWRSEGFFSSRPDQLNLFGHLDVLLFWKVAVAGDCLRCWPQFAIGISAPKSRHRFSVSRSSSI